MTKLVQPPVLQSPNIPVRKKLWVFLSRKWMSWDLNS